MQLVMTDTEFIGNSRHFWHFMNFSDTNNNNNNNNNNKHSQQNSVICQTCKTTDVDNTTDDAVTSIKTNYERRFISVKQQLEFPMNAV
jgi:hypothetical protein